MIEVTDLTVALGHRVVLRGLDLAVASGESVGLSGDNGSGKTTMIRTIAGELRPRSGRVRIAGFDTQTHLEEVRSRIGVVPHANGLYPLLTVEEHLAFFGRLYGLRTLALRTRIPRLLEFADLQSRRRELASTLSAGMARRLSVACALVHEPLVLLMDEPTDNMDASARQRLYEMVRASQEMGAAVLVATHDPDDLRRLADRVVRLSPNAVVAAIDREATKERARCGA